MNGVSMVPHQWLADLQRAPGRRVPLLMTPDAIPRTPQPGGFHTRLRGKNNWELGVPKCGTGHRRT
jgi:hypothetical protein